MFFCLILYIYGLFFNFVLEYIFVYLLVSNTLINCLFFFLPKSVYLRYGSSFFVFLVGISKGKFSVYQLFLDFLSSLAPYMRFFLQNIRLFFIATVSVEFYLYLGSFLYDTVDFNTLCYLFNFCLDAQTLFTFS